MRTIGTRVKEHLAFLEEKESRINIESYIARPLNSEKALKDELEKTEEKLSVSIPNELKEYYLNVANGTEGNKEEHPVCSERLDIFSHQKIFGVYDYFKLYWETMDVSLNEVNSWQSDEEIAWLEEKNRDYFVCASNWAENFVETFIFDKEGNFYRFYYDQDMHMYDYIKEIEKEDLSIKKSKSFVALIDEYLNYIEKEILEDIPKRLR